MFRSFPRLCRLAVALLALGLATACAAPHNTPDPAVTVTGTVAYRERMALPPDAEVLVTVYKNDAHGRVPVALYRNPSNGQSIPLPFQVTYTPEKTARYDLEASLLSGGRPLFVTDAPLALPVSGPVNLLLQRTLSGETGALDTPQAAPVSPTPDTANNTDSLAGTRWVLVSLYGKPVEVFDNQPEPHLVLAAPSNHTGDLSGSDGCNRLAGKYTLRGNSLTLGNLASTMMLCPQGETQARTFAQVLGSVTTARRDGNRLVLSKNSEQLAVLEARAL